MIKKLIGLSILATSALLFGQANTAGNTTMVGISVQDVPPPPLAIINNSLLDAVQGGTYNNKIQGQNGTKPYVWGLVGTLPAGITLSSLPFSAAQLSSGNVTASPGTYSFSLSLTDNAGLGTTVTKPFTLVVLASAPGCGGPFFPCSLISTTIFPLSDPTNANPSCYDNPTGSCKEPVPLLSFSNTSCKTATGSNRQCRGGLFGANSATNGFSGAAVGSDSFYNNNRMVRLTDAQLDSGNLNVSYFSDSSAENPQTNYDGTIIKVTGKAWADLLSFDSTAWATAACNTGSSTCTAFQLQLVGKGGAFPNSFLFGLNNSTPPSPATATSDNLAFYAFDNCPFGGQSTCAKIERWLITKGTPWTVALDPNWPTTASSGYDVTQANCLGSTYMTASVVGQGLFTPWSAFGNTAMNSADNRFIAEVRTFSGVQDEGGLSVLVDTSTAGSPKCKWLDIGRGTLSTDWNTPAPLSAGLTTAASAVVNVLLPPTTPVISNGGSGSLNAGHSYAVSLAYSLRNSTGTSKSPGDLGETNGSVVALITGVTQIAITPPGLPLDASPGVTPVAGQNIPGSNCALGIKKTRCIVPTGFQVGICDRTASPGCTPVRAQLDQAPTAPSSLTCTPQSNTGSTYSYTYTVVARTTATVNGKLVLPFSSQDVSTTCTTGAPISSSQPNLISWTAPTLTNTVYDVYRNSREQLLERLTCAASPCTLSDQSIGPVSAVSEMVLGATTTGVTISALPAASSSLMYTGVQATSGPSTHNMKMDNSGNPIVIGPTAISNKLGFPIADYYWYPDTAASCNSIFQSCPFVASTIYYCPFACSGHRVSAFGGQLRDPANTSNLQFMLAAPNEGLNMISAVNDSICTGSCTFAFHTNWSLGDNSFTQYALASTYRAVTAYGAGAWPTALFQGEALGIPIGDSRVTAPVTSISQTGTTVTATLGNAVNCQNATYNICFAPGMYITTASIPAGVSNTTNWNGQHIITGVSLSPQQITWASGAFISDTAGSGGTTIGCGGGLSNSNPNCYPIRFGQIYSNGNEATRFYGTPRCFTSQAGASVPFIFCSSSYTNFNESATHFDGNVLSISRTSNVVTATFTSTTGFVSGENITLIAGGMTGNTTSFAGEFVSTGVTGTTITWAQTAANDSGTGKAGVCTGATTSAAPTCADASDSFGFGSSLGNFTCIPDIVMNTTTFDACRTDLVAIEMR